MKQISRKLVSVNKRKFFLSLIVCLLFSTTGNFFAQTSYDPAYYLIYHDLYGNNLSERGIELIEEIELDDWWHVRIITAIPSGKKVGIIIVGENHKTVIMPYEIDDLLSAFDTMRSLAKERGTKTELMREKYQYTTKYTRTLFGIYAYKQGTWKDFGDDETIDIRVQGSDYKKLERAKQTLEEHGISNWKSDVDPIVTDVYELCHSLAKSLNRKDKFIP